MTLSHSSVVKDWLANMCFCDCCRVPAFTTILNSAFIAVNDGVLVSHVKHGFRTIVMYSKPQTMDFELLFGLVMVWASAESGAPSCHASDQGEWWLVLRRLASG